MILDEIDKVGRRTSNVGNPSAALLELLDPAQNTAFVDRYAGLPIDLGEVPWIGTANDLEAMPAPMRDRMDVIEVPGYTDEEKIAIVRRHLDRIIESSGLAVERLWTGGPGVTPRERTDAGRDAATARPPLRVEAADHAAPPPAPSLPVEITDAAIRAVIRGHTCESGVRQLLRLVGAVCEEVACRRVTTGDGSPVLIVAHESERPDAPATRRLRVDQVLGSAQHETVPDAVRDVVAREQERVMALPRADPEAARAFDWIEVATDLPWNRRAVRVGGPAVKPALDRAHVGCEQQKQTAARPSGGRRRGHEPGGSRRAAVPDGDRPASARPRWRGRWRRALGRGFVEVSLAGVRDAEAIRGIARPRPRCGAGMPGDRPAATRSTVRVQGRRPGGRARPARPAGRGARRRRTAPRSRPRPQPRVSRSLCRTADRSVGSDVAGDRGRPGTGSRYAARPPGRDIAAWLLRERESADRGRARHPAPVGAARVDARAVVVLPGGHPVPDPRVYPRGGGEAPRPARRRLRPARGAPFGREDGRWPGEVGPEALGAGIAEPPFREGEFADRTRRPGVAVALGVSPAGGRLGVVEARCFAGRGAVRITGTLGTTMREWASVALTWVREHAHRLDALALAFRLDRHPRAPAGGGRRQDGPSAGVTIVTAVVSVLTGKAVRPGVAMTGEITLSGDVLPVGSVEEKLLAAGRCGMAAVVVPTANRPDVMSVGDELRREIAVHYAATIDDVLNAALPGALRE